ncbi:hypothetical protein KIN20_002371 [Parelaphostrongylus tenuis]|uniref:Uncharacterized protein n=1 Tax=Parelaphostrongylus tenuis TaxID=148309 RepID=A0AAD5QGQ0_PARTN|nr:hypothetical protein KIN20_002371 [Parelaphostrongylus tenuis]
MTPVHVEMGKPLPWMTMTTVERYLANATYVSYVSVLAHKKTQDVKMEGLENNERT